MRNKIVMLVLSAVVIVSLVLVGCAPEAAPPEEGAPPPEEEEAAPPAAPEEEVFHWRAAILYPRGISFEALYHQFCLDVEEMSGGRLIIEDIYDGEGVSATEIHDACSSGLVEMGFPYTMLHAGVFPPGVVTIGLPGGPPTMKEVRVLFDERGWTEILRKAYAEHNMYFLHEYYQPGTYLCTKEPINTLDDIKGMKIRCPGAYGELINNIGGKAVVVAFAEVYTSLATGVVDGVDGCNIIDHRDGKFYELAQYMYPLSLSATQAGPQLVNMDAWNSLPDDLKAILDHASISHSLLQEIKSWVWEREALDEMLAAGLKWDPAPSEADRAKWFEAGAKTWDKYAAEDKYCAEMIKIQREFMKELGYI